MTDDIQHNGTPEEIPVSGAEETASEQERFLAAVDRAKLAQAAWKAQLGPMDAGIEEPKYIPAMPALLLLPPSRRVFAAAAAVLLIGFSVGLVLLLPSKRQLVAAEFRGVQGYVKSSFDLKPVGGAEGVSANDDGQPAAELEVAVSRKSRESAKGVLVALPACHPVLNIPAAESVDSDDYILLFNGKQVGEFKTGPEERKVRGYVRNPGRCSSGQAEN